MDVYRGPWVYVQDGLSSSVARHTSADAADLKPLATVPALVSGITAEDACLP